MPRLLTRPLFSLLTNLLSLVWSDNGSILDPDG